MHGGREKSNKGWTKQPLAVPDGRNRGRSGSHGRKRKNKRSSEKKKGRGTEGRIYQNQKTKRNQADYR